MMTSAFAGADKRQPSWRVRIAVPLAVAAIMIAVSAAVLCLVRRAPPFIDNLKNGGGFVDYEYHGPRWFRRLLGERNPFRSAVILTFGRRTTDEDLAKIGALAEVAHVCLNETEVKGPGLAYLKRLPKLDSLELNKSRITDDGLQYLQGLQTLTSLALSYNHVTDRGLEHLRSLTNLQVVTLRETEVTDKGLEALGGMHLTLLDVRRTLVTADGIARLRKANREVSIMGP